MNTAAKLNLPKKQEKTANPSGFGPVFSGLMTQTQAAQCIAEMKWPHYVYALCTHTGAAFYVGKGTGPRLFAHKEESDQGHQSAKCEMIRRAGSRLRYSIFAVCRDPEYAFGLEACLINNHYTDLTNVATGSVSALMGLLVPPSPIAEMEECLAETFAALDRAEEEVNRFAGALL